MASKGFGKGSGKKMDFRGTTDVQPDDKKMPKKSRPKATGKTRC